MNNMKKYSGTKVLLAIAMTLQDYNDYHGWKLPEDQNGGDEGYLVEYQDGGKANHPDHEGYISWSPKDVFERTYSGFLDPLQQRVIDEKNELDAKHLALSGFVGGDIFNNLDPGEQERLCHQCEVMSDYSSILAERLLYRLAESKAGSS